MIETTHERVRKGEHDTDGYMVYAIYDDDGRCAYVGSSRNISERFRQHYRQHGAETCGVNQLFPGKKHNYQVYLFEPEEILQARLILEPSVFAFRYKHNPIKQKAITAEWITWKLLNPYANKKAPF
jgi:hypothetical protein